MAARHAIQGFTLSEQRINKLSGYSHPAGPKVALMVPNLRKILKPIHYTADESYRSTYIELTRKLESLECSYPLMGLSVKYLVTEHLRSDAENVDDPPDHVVIALQIKKDGALLFDPFMPFSKSDKKNTPLGKMGLTTISASKLLDEYWSKAIFGPWMFWLERLPDQGNDLRNYIQ